MIINKNELYSTLWVSCDELYGLETQLIRTFNAESAHG